MLYERWREIAGRHGNEMALHDIAARRRWTFAELNAASEAEDPAKGPVRFPSGISTDFILEVLRAWRSAKIVCPLEDPQSRPQFERFPAGCAHLKTTSATSGAPRVIAFTETQLIADADNIVTTMRLRSDWPNLGVISLAHSYGFSNLVLPLLLHGIPLLLLNTNLPDAIRGASCHAERITLPAVPALWRAWHDAGSIPSNVHLAISAGAPLSLPLELQVFEATGVKIHNFYGASECGGIAYDRTSIPRTDATVVGSPMNNVEASLDENGCLMVRGKAVGETYWPEPEPNLAGGVYRTSDLAELKDGLVSLRGRASDLINVAGRKIRPEAIEQTLLAHPLVSDCLVFGIPSEETDRTETIAVCVVSRAGATIEALKEFLQSQLPAWQVPREWAFTDSLPANRRGKLARAEWRQWFLDRKAARETGSSRCS